VRCGIENILCLLEYNNDVVEKADLLSRRASSYITRHDSISSKISDGDVIEDTDRLRAANEAFADFSPDRRCRRRAHIRTFEPSQSSVAWRVTGMRIATPARLPKSF
jgi:hypothetical protein